MTTSYLPDELCEQIARLWREGGAPVVERVAVCPTLRSAERARRAYGSKADVRPSREGDTFEVWVPRAS